MATITAPVCVHCNIASTIELSDAEVKALDEMRFIQDALPNRTDDERELLMTGTHSACWDALFPPEDEDGELNFDDVPFDETF